jgi:hypothetical protein
VLDPLVNWQDREIAGAGQPAVVEQRLQAAQDAGGPVAGGEDAVDEVGARQVELRARDGLAGVFQQVLGVVAQDRLQLAQRRRGCGGHRHPPVENLAFSLTRIHRSDDADWDARRDERKEATSTRRRAPVGA